MEFWFSLYIRYPLSWKRDIVLCFESGFMVFLAGYLLLASSSSSPLVRLLPLILLRCLWFMCRHSFFLIITLTLRMACFLFKPCIIFCFFLPDFLFPLSFYPCDVRVAIRVANKKKKHFGYYLMFRSAVILFRRKLSKSQYQIRSSSDTPGKCWYPVRKCLSGDYWYLSSKEENPDPTQRYEFMTSWNFSTSIMMVS